MKTYALLFLFLVSCFNAIAQGNFNLSGTILNENSEPIEAATVFIDGSKKISKTDANGEYILSGLSSGGYHLVVNMVGYGSIKQDVLILDKSITLNIKLISREQTLKEVVIVGDSQRYKYLNTFKRYFLGESENAAGCTILNSDIINFNLKGQILTASTDDFLLIENAVLGYRVKYLLRNFQYNSYLETTQYQGQCIFEEMNGSLSQHQMWRQNRSEAYYGSLMHYLRSLYKGTTEKEGFLTYKVLNIRLPIDIETDPVKCAKLLKQVDSNLIAIKYKRRIYTIYNKALAARGFSFKKSERIVKELDDRGSIFKTDGKIDSKGNYINYKELLVQGYWGRKRIGDQLPYEYVPN
ncbi:carboxypeptidase-like regulatory domain-containing protein [Pedobacter sp. JCM 36344]|uniref:carboxypeptidase-like regulatory domain-containing protein n=1 Tax=Pedobacter sp. JCM 36344 TaxID=3374280 RepID=UPI003978BFD7